MNNIDYKAVVEILENFLKKEKTEILGISVGEEYQLRQAIENLIQEYKEWKKYATEEIEEEITELNNKNCELEFKIEHLIQENKELEEKRKNGTLSDGYHTYNDLYYQRCVLFATICNLNKDRAWKSKKHSDGKKCFDSGNWFIVGIDTPEGSYTYHYEMKYWDMFNVKELEIGKIWDGHTEKDVTRLLTLEEGE